MVSSSGDLLRGLRLLVAEWASQGHCGSIRDVCATRHVTLVWRVNNEEVRREACRRMSRNVNDRLNKAADWSGGRQPYTIGYCSDGAYLAWRLGSDWMR
jgi:hypothetical protein